MSNFIFQSRVIPSPPRVKSEELLAPEDIKITYSEADNSDPASKNLFQKFEAPELIHPVAASLTQDKNAYDNFEAWNKMYGDERSGSGLAPPEPPRVLPSSERENEMTDSEKSGELN